MVGRALPGALNLITDVPGLKVGQAEDAAVRTGVSVILPDERSVCACDVRGCAPGTRETDALQPENLVEAVDAVVNLSGAGIGDHRWTDEYKRTLLDSRLRSTELLARTIAALEPRPSVLISGSAIGFYRARGDEELDVG